MEEDTIPLAPGRVEAGQGAGEDTPGASSPYRRPATRREGLLTPSPVAGAATAPGAGPGAKHHSHTGLGFTETRGDGADTLDSTGPAPTAQLNIQVLPPVGSDRVELSPPNRLTRRNIGIVRQRGISEMFYGDSVSVQGPANASMAVQSLPISEDVKKIHTHQSRRLPFWIWFVLAKSLGIKLRQNDRPVFGTILHAVTCTFAVMFAITFTWFTIYDIKSLYTKQTVLKGIVAISICIYWCSLGIYANRLAGNLFGSKKFLDSVRLHSRTVFKVSAAGLMIIIGAAEIGLNNYNTVHQLQDSHCANVSLSVQVCRVMYASRVGYSIFCLVWNLLVGIVLLSVARTHTIGIRRFIKQLEEDGNVYELHKRNLYLQGPCNVDKALPLDSDSEEDSGSYNWDDILPEVSDGFHSYLESPPTPYQTTPPGTPLQRVNHRGNRQSSPEKSAHLSRNQSSVDDNTQDDLMKFPETENMRSDLPVSDNRSGSVGDTRNVNSPANGTRNNNVSPPRKPAENRPIIIVKESSVGNSEDGMSDGSGSGKEGREAVDQPVVPPGGEGPRLIQPDPPSFASRSTQRSMRVEVSSPQMVLSSLTEDCLDSSEDNISLGPNTLSVDDILLSYWRINCRLRSTSLALQRWLVAMVMFIIVWSCTFLVYWVDHDAKLSGIAEFMLPIFLLPLVCSAYGEVNTEGKRMLKCVCPMEERIQMILMLNQQPLELTVFGFPINYSTVLKTIGALALAFLTKIVLEEINY